MLIYTFFILVNQFTVTIYERQANQDKYGGGHHRVVSTVIYTSSAQSDADCQI